MATRTVSVSTLEMHITNFCNLACESCSHYSNQGHTGSLSVSDATIMMNGWGSKIQPETFRIMGGEPTIHPELCAMVSAARAAWPNAKIEIVTNGFFLHNHPDLPKLIKDDGNISIELSIHDHRPEYKNALSKNFELIEKWQREYGIAVNKTESYLNWTRRYKGFGTSFRPYTDNNQRKSWEACSAKHCLQLYNNKLWKCPPITYLRMQTDKYGLSESSMWKPYLQYDPLSINATYVELKRFVGLQDENICAMCPANPERFELPLPLVEK